MNDPVKSKVVARLRKVAGQVGGIGRMVEGDRYCVDVLLQIAAARAALGEVAKLVLRSHVETVSAPRWPAAGPTSAVGRSTH